MGIIRKASTEHHCRIGWEHRLAYYEDISMFSSAPIQVDPRDLAALIAAYRQSNKPV